MKKILSFLLALVLLSFAAAPCGATYISERAQYDGRFSDVPQNAWFYEYVSICSGLGFISGRSDTAFFPSGNIKISEAVKLACVLRRAYMEGDPLVETSVWYDVYFDYALSCGMLKKVPDDPSAAATRIQFAELIAAAMPGSEYPEINRIDSGVITDADGFDAVYMLYRAGVLTGGEDGSFRPNDRITRAEAAAVLVRAAQDTRRVRFSITYGGDGSVSLDASAAAAEVFTLTNSYRTEHGLAALSRDEKLEAAAAKRARELAERYSHTRPDGTSCFTAFDEYGVDYTGAGENIAIGYVDASGVTEAWIASPGHLANITGRFDRLATACYISDDGIVCWVQLFAAY